MRIVKTKRDLRTALVTLLKEQPFEKISVSEICQTAMINRMTFYKHFDDKYDLLNHTLDAIVENILQENQNRFEVEHFGDDPVGFCTSLLVVVMDECLKWKDVLQSLIVNDSGIVHDLLINSIRKDIEKLIRALDEISPAKYSVPAIAAFIAGGASQLIYYWITHPNEYSKEQFVKSCITALKDLMQSDVFFRKPFKSQK